MEITFDREWYKMIREMEESIRNKDSYQTDFVEYLSQGLLKICKELSPIKDGELRQSWQIFTKTLTEVVIGTDLVDAYSRIVNGMKPQVIYAKNAKAMHFFIGNQEYFRQKVDIRGTPPDDFLQPLLDKAVDKVIEELAVALMPKHMPFFRTMTPKPRAQPTKRGTINNITKTVGLTGTKRNARRGRGSGVQRAKTGRKSFRRTLSRRRRTGKFITSKNTKVG
jgi:hypothetical protein